MKCSPLHTWIYFAVILIAATFVSCSDQADLRSVVVSGEDAGVSLFIPDVEEAAHFGATRADEFRNSRAIEDADEAKINNLWFFAYPLDDLKNADPTRPHLVKRLSPGDAKSVDQYKKYEVGYLQEGQYHIYVLANLEDYLPSGLTFSEFTPESVIKALVLNFPTNVSLVSGNLPMACLNTEVKYSDGEGTVRDGIFEVKKGSDGTYNHEIYADLSFLCAKVRYTILFDRTTGGFSTGFPASDIEFEEEVVPTNIFDKTNLIGHTDLSLFPEEELENYPLWRVLYPKGEEGKESGYLKSEPTFEDNLTPIDGEIIEAWESEDQRAWQGIAYLPENPESDEGKRVKLTFSPSGSGVKMNYSFTLFADGSTLLRGKYYDLTSKLEESQSEELNINFNVKNWTTENLQYSLHGPYRLTVEETKIGVKSGEWTVMGYESDVNVELISPDFGETKLFKIEKITSTTLDEKGQAYDLPEKWPNYLRITVNPEISYNELSGKDLREYQYFTIKTGNLYKKIEVDPLDIQPILSVTPQNIVIDVRALTGSGTNALTLPIKFVTNMPVGPTSGITFTLSGDSGLLNGSVASALWLQDPGKVLSPTDGSYDITKREGTLNLNISGILSGKAEWNKPAKYELNFTLKSGDGQTELEEKLTIEVLPYNSDYVIHFRSTDPEHPWTNPHVYVYQCLELPSELGDIGDGNNGWIKAGGKTVGYNASDGASAAIEYMFSNNIAFRGWEGFGGTVSTDFEDNTKYKDGFVMLRGDADGAENASPFNPSNGKTDYYDYSLDLNSSHAKNQAHWACEICREKYATPSDYNVWGTSSSSGEAGSHLFPGVSMEKEYDEKGKETGWFKYTLSGLATPGKCLIIFFNYHEWLELPPAGDSDPYNEKKDNEKYYRFPTKENGKDTAGVPLFEYADNEGWFVFDGDAEANRTQYFVDDKPEIPQTPETGVYRFYWPFYLGPEIHLWTDSKIYTDFQTSEGDFDPDTGYFYYDMKSYSEGELKYILQRIDNDYQATGLTLNDFKNDGNYNYAYIASKGEKAKPGIPDAIYKTGLYLSPVYWRSNGQNSFSNDFLFWTLYFNNIEELFRLEGITENKDKGFKIGPYGWNYEGSTCNLGSNGSPVFLNSLYKLNNSNNSNDIIMGEELNNGTAYLLKDKRENYYLYLLP